MSKPRGTCVFCGSDNLTKSHVWPEWSQTILPSSAARYEIAVGEPMQTFKQTVPGPEFVRKVRPGSVAKRQPRNTCFNCNSGWMRSIEEAAKPIVEKLIRDDKFLMSTIEQRLLATFLCLVSMRIEMSGDLRAIPDSDRDWLIKHREPPPTWCISFCRYYDKDPHDYWFAFMGMRRVPLSERPLIGSKNCNTQVTTMVVGRLCAHLFSSTVWDDFAGYEGAHLTKVWPPVSFAIDTREVPYINNTALLWLHEAIARDGMPPDGLGR